MTQKNHPKPGDAQTHSAVQRSQHVLREVQQAVLKSQALEASLEQAVQTSWDCSRQALEKKMTAIFGEPSERQLFMARQALETRFFEDSPVTPHKAGKPFVVSNPI